MTTDKELHREWTRGYFFGCAMTLLLIALAFWMSGCGTVCTYKGKAVGQRDAANMKALGMDVQCPENN